MAEYRYYLIPDAMTRAFPEQFGKQTPTEFFDNIADLEKRYHQLREMPYNNERTWNERTRFPYARLVVGIDRQNPDGAVAIIQVRNGVNYLCDDYRGPYADRSDAQIPQMAKKLVEVIGVDRVRPHTYTQRDGYTWVQVEKDMHITEWLYAHELCSSLQFTRFLNRDGRELFQVRDGQRVIETNADGTKRLRAVKNIDVTHAYVGHYGCHIQQYAEDNFRIGCYVAPEHPQPGDNLDKLQVYQITKGGCEYRFMNYAYSKSRIHAADYSSVYIANLPADYDLDRCFQEFNAPNAGNAVSARYTKTITLPNGARGFQGWYKDGEDAYGNVEWASLLYRMDWEELYGIVDGIKCRATGSGMTEEELRQLFASLNIDATTARGQVVAFALSCQGKFVYRFPFYGI